MQLQATTAPATIPATPLSTTSATVTSICSQIIQEGMPDLSCMVSNANGTTTEFCYVPICYACTSTNQLCPINAPNSCGTGWCDTIVKSVTNMIC